MEIADRGEGLDRVSKRHQGELKVWGSAVNSNYRDDSMIQEVETAAYIVKSIVVHKLVRVYNYALI